MHVGDHGNFSKPRMVMLQLDWGWALIWQSFASSSPDLIFSLVHGKARGSREFEATIGQSLTVAFHFSLFSRRGHLFLNKGCGICHQHIRLLKDLFAIIPEMNCGDN
ncbi:hypothetical protein Nepgr_026022 [Nepenthes gracilis]|uniref:Uncharacterized protein n=1 Tax=Nepenthes gracilis TaxID=150966 RepID=A0AAD3Y1N2_NEPGR|nr:hypothetical protein Nepgr_026022 [Nepenthes gracilis]